MVERDGPSIDSNYITAENVRARFHAYSVFAEKDKLPTDPDIMELEIARMLRLEHIRNIFEVGYGDGTYLDLISDYSQRVSTEDIRRIVGFEPNNTQRRPNQALNLDARLRLSLQEHGITLEPVKSQPTLVGQRAESIAGLDDGSVDCLLAFYVMYHLEKLEQEKVLENSKRILGPDGIFIATTSSEDNKHGHRVIESFVANALRIQPPAFMNSSFTSETASSLLPEYFKSVYRADVTGELQKEGFAGVDKTEVMERYIQSQLSLADQYDPSQITDRRVHSLFASTVKKLVEREFDNPEFTDSMQRTVFIASQTQLDANHPYINMFIPRPDLYFEKVAKATSFL